MTTNLDPDVERNYRNVCNNIRLMPNTPLSVNVYDSSVRNKVIVFPKQPELLLPEEITKLDSLKKKYPKHKPPVDSSPMQELQYYLGIYSNDSDADDS